MNANDVIKAKLAEIEESARLKLKVAKEQQSIVYDKIQKLLPHLGDLEHGGIETFAHEKGYGARIWIKSGYSREDNSIKVSAYAGNGYDSSRWYVSGSRDGIVSPEISAVLWAIVNQLHPSYLKELGRNIKE